MPNQDAIFMRQAVELADQGMKSGKGGPFGAIVVKDGKVIGAGSNSVVIGNDPTAHAEVVAIRNACQFLKSFQLDGCVIYTSCEPCPMCLGAIYWARPAKVFYSCTRKEAAASGFDDNFIYEELAVEIEKRKIPFIKMDSEEADRVLAQWINYKNKVDY